MPACMTADDLGQSATLSFRASADDLSEAEIAAVVGVSRGMIKRNSAYDKCTAEDDGTRTMRVNSRVQSDTLVRAEDRETERHADLI